jgi:mannose-1-phosphate guanylyltransferase
MNIVIMAGGSGTRFWPMSRGRRPKQLLNIVGGKPMIWETYQRVKDLAPDERIILVIGQEHEEETQQLFDETGVRILVEPMGRNTAPCIGLAAQYVDYCGNEDPLIILPADHYIAHPDIFRQALSAAANLAAQGGIVTLGIVPTRPETGYGYIHRDKPVAPESNAYGVRGFVEKPQLAVAEEYLVSGEFYWNAGIFAATAGTLLREFSIHMPLFAQGLKRLSSSFDTSEFSSALAKLYEETEKISFDYAIMEETSQSVYVIPCQCGWSDVGSWYSLYEVRRGREQDEDENVKDGESLLLDCQGSFVVSRGGRWVAALGLRKVLVVDTEDALLVADLERSQEIKEVTAYLEAKELKELL